ncbi:hypothetical protein F5Y05DRAFT_410032 [Hypoxylon sp. FL0543]|nr:hypothetical protein F5Y05DRAFT_410032 [Hypoxylon sp. FL0543]
MSSRRVQPFSRPPGFFFYSIDALVHVTPPGTSSAVWLIDGRRRDRAFDDERPRMSDCWATTLQLALKVIDTAPASAMSQASPD